MREGVQNSETPRNERLLMTRGERNIRWCQDHLHLPEGRFVGQPLRMAAFMQDDFRAIYDNPDGTRRAIISRGRKNAKTTECACILLLHLCGPEHRVNSQMFSCAQSRDQAAVLFSLAAKIVRLSPKLQSVIQIRDTAKELLCPALGTSYKALSAEASTAYGLSPALTVHDELGQVRGPRSALYEALETATAAQEDPLTIVISTQAPSDGDLLSALIDDAQAGHDPTTVLRLNTAPGDADPFAEETVRLANPAFDVFMNAREVMAMASDAKRMPAREAAFRNLVLNQRVEAESPFLARGLWDACAGAPADLTGREVYAGLDLSEVSDLTALVLIGRDIATGIWSVKPTFWLPSEGLAEKSAHDRQTYDLWAAKGFLETTPGASVQYEYIAQYLYEEVFAKHRVVKLAFDRWNFKHLKPWLLAAGFGETTIAEKFEEFGQGTASMSAPLRELEGLVLDRKLRHGNHPLLNMCCANSVVEGSDASNRKLSKKRSTGRIDGMVALVMAIGVAPLSPVKFDVNALIG
jgi:phage terminase large subunit-like protein